MMIGILTEIAALMVVIERLWPGQALPMVRLWWLRIVLVNAALDRLVCPTAGIAPRPPPVPASQPKLRRPAAVGLDLRHPEKPTAITIPLRLRSGKGAALHRDAGLSFLTWATLAAELLFLPLAAWWRTRPWIWLTLVVVHLGIMVVVDFADLSLGMLMIHLFTFDAAWLPALRGRVSRLRRSRPSPTPVPL